jgi:hypothetical protein
MAIQIEFSGFINEVKKFEWGTVYDISHSQRMQNDNGEWETAGYDYFSVIGDPGFEANQRVTVKGRMKTKRYEKKDGGTGVKLEVRADSITEYQSQADVPF